MTLGYDPQKHRYIGTWIGSMMNHLWLYEGAVDGSGNILALESKGPSMKGDAKVANYRDVIEFKSDDHRLLISYAQDDDGSWKEIMRVRYRKRK
jgi:hypothetical protein